MSQERAADGLSLGGRELGARANGSNCQLAACVISQGDMLLDSTVNTQQ